MLFSARFISLSQFIRRACSSARASSSANYRASIDYSTKPSWLCLLSSTVYEAPWLASAIKFSRNLSCFPERSSMYSRGPMCLAGESIVDCLCCPGFSLGSLYPSTDSCSIDSSCLAMYMSRDYSASGSMARGLGCAAMPLLGKPAACWSSLRQSCSYLAMICSI